MFSNLNRIFQEYMNDEEGLALTEYLILLGLLTAAVIAAVLIVGGELGDAWGTWAAWFQGTDMDAPAVPVTSP